MLIGFVLIIIGGLDYEVYEEEPIEDVGDAE